MRTAVTKTSIDAYYDPDRMQNALTQQARIIVLLETNGSSCIADLAHDMRLDKSTVSARLNELKKDNAVRYVGKDISRTTRRRVDFWAVKVKRFSETLF